MKRAASNNLDDFVFASKAEKHHDALLQEFRKVLFEWLLLGSMDAAKISTIAFFCSELGIRGMSDLATNPKNGNSSKNGSAKVKLLLSREFRNPQMTYVTIPTYDKLACQRSSQDIPVRLPSNIFPSLFKPDHRDEPLLEPSTTKQYIDAQCWSTHPVVPRAHWSRVVAGALYMDGPCTYQPTYTYLCRPLALPRHTYLPTYLLVLTCTYQLVQILIYTHN
jgi:hypothetical protein